MGEARHFLGVYYSNTAVEGTRASRDAESQYWEGGRWGSRDNRFVFAMVEDVNRIHFGSRSDFLFRLLEKKLLIPA